MYLKFKLQCTMVFLFENTLLIVCTDVQRTEYYNYTSTNTSEFFLEILLSYQRKTTFSEGLQLSDSQLVNQPGALIVNHLR